MKASTLTQIRLDMVEPHLANAEALTDTPDRDERALDLALDNAADRLEAAEELVERSKRRGDLTDTEQDHARALRHRLDTLVEALQQDQNGPGAHSAKNHRTEAASQKGLQTLVNTQGPAPVSHSEKPESDPLPYAAGTSCELTQSPTSGTEPIRLETFVFDGDTNVNIRDSDGYEVNLSLDEARRVGLLLSRLVEDE